jgi:hypothetical protein
MAKAMKGSAADRLAAATHELQEAQRQVAEAEADRSKALLSDRDDIAAELATTIDGLRGVIRGRTDKIRLLQSEIEREEADVAAKRHEVHVAEFASTLEQADRAGDELEGAVALLEQKFREVTKLRELALSMWPHGASSHADAASRSPEGAALAAGAVVTLLQHEIHRVGSESRLGGDPHERVKVPLPGGVPSRLTPLIDRKTGQLIPLKPLGEILRAASKFAVETLRDNRFVPPVVPQPPTPILVLGVEQPPPPAPSPAAATPRPPAVASDVDGLKEYVPPAFRERLAALHARQMKLAAGDDDAAYEQCLADLVALRNEIERARQGEAA